MGDGVRAVGTDAPSAAARTRRIALKLEISAIQFIARSDTKLHQPTSRL